MSNRAHIACEYCGGFHRSQKAYDACAKYYLHDNPDEARVTARSAEHPQFILAENEPLLPRREPERDEDLDFEETA